MKNLQVVSQQFVYKEGALLNKYKDMKERDEVENGKGLEKNGLLDQAGDESDDDEEDLESRGMG